MTCSRKNCENTFHSSNPLRIYCDRHKYGARRPAPTRDFTCPCGAVETTNHPTKRFCSIPCARRGTRGKPAGSRPKPCVKCGQEFEPQSGNQRWCQKCGSRATPAEKNQVAARESMARRQKRWVDTLADSQGGYYCAGCGRDNIELQIDHDHTCPNSPPRGHPGNARHRCDLCIRWLVCGPCNDTIHACEDLGCSHPVISPLLATWKPSWKELHLVA